MSIQATRLALLAGALEDAAGADIWFESFDSSPEDRMLTRKVFAAQRDMQQAARALREFAETPEISKTFVQLATPVFCGTNVCVHNTEVTSEAVVYEGSPAHHYCPGCDFELEIDEETEEDYVDQS